MMLSRVSAVLIAIGAMVATSNAFATSFLYSGAIEDYEITQDGWYAFAVAGAQGGNGTGPTVGGGGAIISGDLYFAAGANLAILIGGKGAMAPELGNGNAGSGGGMSFIALNDLPLIVAGGGGGSNWFSGYGGAGQIGTEGQSVPGAAGGTNGSGGQGPGAGAGWLSSGNGGVGASETDGGGGFTGPTFTGGQGYIGSEADFHPGPGAIGGFGGGGGGGYSCGGGGGGYSGGAAGCIDGNQNAGGGGGSFVSPLAINVFGAAGANMGIVAYNGCFEAYCPISETLNDGYITLDLLPGVPEPSEWTFLITGFFAAGAMIRRRGQRSRSIAA